MRISMRFFSLFLVLAWLAGCVSMGRKIDQSAAEKIEKGKTTREQVINLIGSPDNITRTGRGRHHFFVPLYPGHCQTCDLHPDLRSFGGRRQCPASDVYGHLRPGRRGQRLPQHLWRLRN